MLIFLYGQDTFRSRQKLNEIIASYQKIHKSGLNLKYFLGTETDFNTFKDTLRQTSMFKEKKLIVLVDIFLNPEFKEKFLETGKDFVKSQNIILFYEENSIPEKDHLFLFLKKHSQSQEFKPLEGENLKTWIKKEFENFRMKIEQKALDKLIEFVGNDLWQMDNEIKKLVNYKKKNQNIEILSQDVEILVKPKFESDIFETIDAIASKDKKKALKLLKEHLEKGDAPLYLFSMIVFQFRNLLMVKDLIEKNLSPYSLTGVHPFVIKKSTFLSNKFKFLELKKIYQKIFQIDLDIKTGKIEPETALDLLITELS